MQLKPDKMGYNYKKGDWQAMRENTKNSSLSEGNKQQQWDYSFEDKLHQMIDVHLPVYYHEKSNPPDKNPGSQRKLRKFPTGRTGPIRSGRRVHTEKDQSKFLALHIRAQATVRKTHKEYT